MYQISRSIRDCCTFARQNLCQDPPFSRLDLVSCRNVLIYFNRELQDRALGLFRDALCRKGFLGLGSKESLRFSAHADDFDTVVAADRIYQRRDSR